MEYTYRLETAKNRQKSTPVVKVGLGVLAVAADLITNAPDRSNQGPVVSGIQLAAKIIDVHVHDVRSMNRIANKQRMP